MLEWTNHECPYVRKHYETSNMQGLQKEATGQGVIWLTIISSAPNDAGARERGPGRRAHHDARRGPTAVLLDPTGVVGKSYGATNTPHMYVIDKAGMLSYAGAIDDRPTSRKSDVPGAQNYVRAALAVGGGGPAGEDAGHARLRLHREVRVIPRPPPPARRGGDGGRGSVAAAGARPGHRRRPGGDGGGRHGVPRGAPR